jgi:LPS O-antigen subunit length determinant protein (WzzB/FepE family)
MEIDKPLGPIKPVGASKKVALALGTGLGILVAALWIFIQKFVRNNRNLLAQNPA